MRRRKSKRQTHIGREKAIRIVMNLNSVPKGVAEQYTDSELRECLRLLKLKTNF